MQTQRVTELTGSDVEPVAPSLSSDESIPARSVTGVSGLGPWVPIQRQCEYRSRGRSFTWSWQDRGEPLPPWFDPLMRGLVDLLTLPQGWDYQGAGPIDSNLVERAAALMGDVLTRVDQAPWVVPLSDGGIQLEWHRNGADLEIEIDPSGNISGYWFHGGSGEEREFEIPKEIEHFKTYIARVR